MRRLIAFENDTLTYGDYLHFLRRLGSAESDDVDHYVVDLSRPSFFRPEGMAPLIATIRSLTSRGRRVQLALPEDDLLTYFDSVGWSAALAGEQCPSFRKGSTYLPLSPYETYQELNSLVNDAISVLIENQVFLPGVREAIEWVLNETADNVLNHAASAEPGWLQVTSYPQSHNVDFVVVDTGRGITASLREAFPDLTSDSDAVALAVKKGITRNQEVGQGNGLSGLMRIASGAKGWVRIHSGSACLNLRRGDLVGPDQVPGHQGTLVTVSLPTRTPIDLSEALWGHNPAPAFDFGYLSEEGIAFRVADESPNFGNRYTAAQLRNKLLNLMKGNPNELVIIDFDGVQMVTSSFADEFVAKLAVEMGIVTFFGRCKLRGMTRFIENTVNEVLLQRAAVS